jgi:transposase
VDVVGRGELTDKAWAVIEPLLPRSGGRNGRWRDHRQVINGILWKLRAGAPWRDLPERYRPWKTCHERLARWTAGGTWDLLDAICVKHPGPGRPRKRPDMLIADKAYAHDSTRAALRRRGIRHIIPERSDQVARRAAKGGHGGRPPAFDREVYRERNQVERCFNRFKHWRDLAIRYAKRASIYRASLVLIAALMWLS